MSIAYLFPGQGSHSVGMGKAAYDASAGARDIFAQADDILGFSLSKLCFEGPMETLTETHNQQSALYVSSLATLQAMQESDETYPEPSFMAGHSLGEFSALTAVGSLAFADGMRLVRYRGELMKAAGDKSPGRMAAILGLSPEVVTAACDRVPAAEGVAQIANDNCPGQIVISGDISAIAAVKPFLEEAGARKIVDLPITIAAHSRLMGPAGADFAKALGDVEITAPRLPVIGNTTATPMTTVEQIRAELTAQLTGAVRWTESMEYLVANGVDTIVEIGSGDVLQSLMKRVNRKVKRMRYSG